MLKIPEEKIDDVLDRVLDCSDAVQIQTQAIGKLADETFDQSEILKAIYTAVTAPGDDTLAKTLIEIADGVRTNTELLRQILARR